ncbi:MAG: HEPN domain-containing protein [Betaproteobacteria bacterium]
MKNADRAAAVAAEWISKAEHDLLNAAHTLTLGARCPTDTVCFHAQQCAEKYLKALLTVRGTDFAKTHDLEALAARLRNGPRPALSQDDLARLTRYATVTRYPGSENITLREARRAVAAARRIRRAARAVLPAELRRGKSAKRPRRRS